MTTAAVLITLAKRDSGVLGTGQTPQGQDAADGLRRLNMMISQWSARRWLVYHLVDTACVCTGALSYTVGLGGSFNVARPDRIEAAYIRQLIPLANAPVDWPLIEIKSREEYSKITLKSLAAGPSSHFFYDSDFPLGHLFPWPLPGSAYAVHILTKAVLSRFADAAEEVILPDEYEEAIYLNLMVRERMAARLPADPLVVGLAKAALNTIRRSNFQVGRLSMPKGIARGPTYNVFSDQGG